MAVAVEVAMEAVEMEAATAVVTEVAKVVVMVVLMVVAITVALTAAAAAVEQVAVKETTFLCCLRRSRFLCRRFRSLLRCCRSLCRRCCFLSRRCRSPAPRAVAQKNNGRLSFRCCYCCFLRCCCSPARGSPRASAQKKYLAARALSALKRNSGLAARACQAVAWWSQAPSTPNAL